MIGPPRSDWPAWRINLWRWIRWLWPHVSVHWGEPMKEGGYYWLALWTEAADGIHFWRPPPPRWSKWGIAWAPWVWRVELAGREYKYYDPLMWMEDLGVWPWLKADLEQR